MNAAPSAVTALPPPTQRGEPVWELATLFPAQGEWTEDDFLALDTNRLVELSDGCLEFLPMPSVSHQWILIFLFDSLRAFVGPEKAKFVLIAPLRVHLWAGFIREPDLVYFRPEHIRDLRKPATGAQLAMEVVSEGEENRRRDLITKRQEYAQAGIDEYWIVDPEERRITVLTLDGESYRVHGEFGPGTQATSALLAGFSVSVDAVLAAGNV